MNKEQLDKILAEHAEWLSTDGTSGERANLTGANLTGANLYEANLTGADLYEANLTGADLYEANLYEANLTGADLYEANLYEANLTGADLYEANLTGANLTGADLTGANLTKANLTKANLTGARLGSCIGNRKNIKSIFVSEDYVIVYTSAYMQIGCERHLISEWAEFDNDRITKMDGKRALEFWREWKETIFMLIEKSPAEPTGYTEGKPE